MMDEHDAIHAPHDDALADEYHVLAALVNGVPEIGELVPSEALIDPFCKAVFEQYRKTHGHGEATDLARLVAALGGGIASTRLVRIGIDYDAMPEHAISMAKQIRRRHEGVALSNILAANARNIRSGFEAEGAVERCREAVERYYAAVSGDDNATSIDAILREHGDQLFLDRQRGGVPFNIPTLDAKIGGLHEGELLVVAARPKRGKSSLILSIVAAANVPACVFSLEMTRRECVKNLVCIQGRIPSDALLDFRVEVEKATAELRSRPVHIFDQPQMTAAEIAGACYSRSGTRLVAVDYAQIMGKTAGAESARESLVENVKSLKTLAKRLSATVILGSQIGRGGDEKPTAKDLAESDELLRSADHVLVFDWDDAEPVPETKWERHPVRVTVRLTSRHMPSGTFPLAFHRSQRRFGEVTL